MQLLIDAGKVNMQSSTGTPNKIDPGGAAMGFVIDI